MSRSPPRPDARDAGGERGDDIYAAALGRGRELAAMPRRAGSAAALARQHGHGRMSVWERIEFLADGPVQTLWQNWGRDLDGASLVCALGSIDGRDVAIYGHDFTVRAGAMDKDNGPKLARLLRLAGKLGVPVVGLNDSAGAFVPAGVGGLDGYAMAFQALRQLSGRVPSIMCMFGFNAGGGSYLPRQGSFVIQPQRSFFGLTGPDVVRKSLGEDVSADELGGPAVHGASGVADFVVADEVAALRQVRRLLSYLPSNSSEAAPAALCKDSPQRVTDGIDRLLARTLRSPSGWNTPFDMGILLQQLCDHGDILELQAGRARNSICALGRMAGQVVGLVASNSAVNSGQIDCHAALKNARFVRFCNLYNIPVIFLEDTTGFLPGSEQEAAGIVQAGRAMLDAIIDLRTPRFLVLVRNAFGGAYAAYNSHNTGADHVMALPTTRLAVMGAAGVRFVYKRELRELRAEHGRRAAGGGAAVRAADDWLAGAEAALARRYERELMNPEDALRQGSVSQIVMPDQLRRELCRHLQLHLRHYRPGPLGGLQREFF